MSQSSISTSDDDSMVIDAGEPERDLGRDGGLVRAAAAGGAADQQHGGQGDTEISRVVSIMSIISLTSIISITSTYIYTRRRRSTATTPTCLCSMTR